MKTGNKIMEFKESRKKQKVKISINQQPNSKIMKYLIFLIIISLVMIIISLIYQFNILLIIFTIIEMVAFLFGIVIAFVKSPEKYSQFGRENFEYG